MALGAQGHLKFATVGGLTFAIDDRGGIQQVSSELRLCADGHACDIRVPMPFFGRPCLSLQSRKLKPLGKLAHRR